MSDEELRLKCLELSVQCFGWFQTNRNGIKSNPIKLADLMYQYLKTGEVLISEPYWPQPL